MQLFPISTTGESIFFFFFVCFTGRNKGARRKVSRGTYTEFDLAAETREIDHLNAPWKYIVDGRARRKIEIKFYYLSALVNHEYRAIYFTHFSVHLYIRRYRARFLAFDPASRNRVDLHLKQLVRGRKKSASQFVQLKGAVSANRVINLHLSTLINFFFIVFM